MLMQRLSATAFLNAGFSLTVSRMAFMIAFELSFAQTGTNPQVTCSGSRLLLRMNTRYVGEML